jgi:hypothetical protein
MPKNNGGQEDKPKRDNKYEKRKERRNDPNYKGCAKHTPKDGPQALHTDEECFDNPKNADKKKAWLEKKQKFGKKPKMESNACEAIAMEAVAEMVQKEEDDDDVLVVDEVEMLTLSDEAPKMEQRGGIRGQRDKPNAKDCPKVLTFAESKQKRDDIFEWVKEVLKEVLTEQGAEKHELQPILTKMTGVDKAIRRILSGWCFQWVVPHDIGAEYPHVFKKFYNGTSMNSCMTNTQVHDCANADSHHFD